MGHRTETDRRRHVHARWESFLQCARTRTADEAAHLQHRIIHDDQCRWKSIRCSREENRDLFRLAIGGYGLFGLIDTVTLRLVPRQKLRRIVEIIRADDLPKRFEERIAQKFLYGDFQFSVDEKSPDFLQRGVFSCYEPISEDEPIVAKKELRDDDWLDLLRLAYTDREKAFKRYSDYYLSTNGQTYWSDTNQLSAYLPNYAQKLRDQLGGDESSLSLPKSMFRGRLFPIFWRRQRICCTRIAQRSSMAPSD